MRRRSGGLALLLVFALGTGAAAAARPRLAPGPAAAILMDARTGRIMYAREIHRTLPPASTTKILTAILAIERLAPDTPVVIGFHPAAAQMGSAVGLEAGERWRAEELLRALLLRSANDAAIALAEAVAGSVGQFATLMNARARALGARSTHFVNPHGLDDPAHHTTAYDLAVMTRYALARPRFAAIVRTRSWVLERPDRPAQELINGNKLLGRYPGADGVKTGWTAAAGQTLVATATRDGWQLIAVVLRSHDMYGDVERLLDHGFESFTPLKVARRGDAVAAISLGHRRTRLVATVPADVFAVLRRGAVASSRVEWRRDLRTPIAAGSRVGEVRFLDGRDVIARSPLLAAHSVPR
jgi:D-alanyl-D-alanine carboxypeptidase (penicillin-binding protein 5/6)